VSNFQTSQPFALELPDFPFKHQKELLKFHHLHQLQTRFVRESGRVNPLPPEYSILNKLLIIFAEKSGQRLARDLHDCTDVSICVPEWK
jgi:hypothetical protein